MISAVFPVYCMDQDKELLLLRCFSTFDEHSPASIERIVVDDCSTKGQEVMEEFADKYIKNNPNLGFPKTVNKGLKAALGDIILILNDDLAFTPGWLEHLLKPLKDPKVGVSTIRTSDCDGETTENRLEKDAKFGSCWALKRSVIEKIGYLDESFGRGYFEDLDYQKRMKKVGYISVKNHRAFVYHKGKASFTKIDPEDKIYRQSMEKYREKYGKVD